MSAPLSGNDHVAAIRALMDTGDEGSFRRHLRQQIKAGARGWIGTFQANYRLAEQRAARSIQVYVGDGYDVLAERARDARDSQRARVNHWTHDHARHHTLERLTLALRWLRRFARPDPAVELAALDTDAARREGGSSFSAGRR